MQYIIIKYKLLSASYDYNYIEYLYLDDTNSFLSSIKKFVDAEMLSILKEDFANVYKFSIYLKNNADTLLFTEFILKNKFIHRFADILLHFFKIKSDDNIISSIEFYIITDEI